MTGDAIAIPFTAWQQAVFVALFIFMVLGLLYWFSRQQSVWQTFIQKRDEQWQGFLRDLRHADSETNTKLANVIEKLVVRMECLENKFDAHDATEMEFLRGVIANRDARQDRKTQPRGKPPVP